MNLKIRTEQPSDYSEVSEIVRGAFESAEHSDGTEWQLVSKLRESGSYIPELALVAEINGTIVGHIMMTKLRIGNVVELALAPLSVAPEYQRQSIGSQLIDAVHAEAVRLGYHYSVVLGDDRYYSRFGYRPASDYGILPPFEIEPRFFMAKQLALSSAFYGSVVEYDPAFGL